MIFPIIPVNIKKHFFLSFFIIILVILFHILNLTTPLERKIYDLHFKLRGSIKPSDEIVIIKIDDESLRKLGRWPWERKIIAEGIRKISELKPKLICVDILFVEESKDKSQDLALSATFKNAKNIINSMFFDSQERKIIETVDINGKTKTNIKTISETVPVFPVPSIMEASAGIGFVNISPDPDGYLRRAVVSTRYKDKTYYSLGVISASLYLGKKPEEILNRQEMLVNYRDIGGSYNSYSFYHIYSGMIPKEWIKDKIILLGSTATGAFDHFPTPYDSLFPGVEFNATVIDNIIKGDHIKEIPTFFVILSILLLGICSGLISTSQRISFGIVFSIFILIFYSLISLLFFSKMALYITPFPGGITTILTFISISFHRAWITEKEKTMIKRMFSMYVSPHVIKELITHPEKLKLGGERKILTVLFADIMNFTPLAEKLNPEDVTSILNEFMAHTTDCIFKYNGTLDKYIGDAVMSFWGAPIPLDTHAESAVRCAIEILKKVNEINDLHLKTNKPPLKIGIGINTGEMLVGNIGSAKRFSYTVCGSNVNLAWRLQELTRVYNLPILISQQTYEIIKEKFNTKFIDETTVKGMERKIKIYTVIE